MFLQRRQLAVGSLKPDFGMIPEHGSTARCGSIKTKISVWHNK